MWHVLQGNMCDRDAVVNGRHVSLDFDSERRRELWRPGGSTMRHGEAVERLTRLRERPTVSSSSKNVDILVPLLSAGDASASVRGEGRDTLLSCPEIRTVTVPRPNGPAARALLDLLYVSPS